MIKKNFLAKIISFSTLLAFSFYLNYFSKIYLYEMAKCYWSYIHRQFIFKRMLLNKKNYKYKILLLPKKKLLICTSLIVIYQKFYSYQNHTMQTFISFSVYGFCSFDPSRYFTNQNTPDAKLLKRNEINGDA